MVKRFLAMPLLHSVPEEILFRAPNSIKEDSVSENIPFWAPNSITHDSVPESTPSRAQISPNYDSVPENIPFLAPNLLHTSGPQNPPNRHKTACKAQKKRTPGRDVRFLSVGNTLLRVCNVCKFLGDGLLSALVVAKFKLVEKLLGIV